MRERKSEASKAAAAAAAEERIIRDIFSFVFSVSCIFIFLSYNILALRFEEYKTNERLNNGAYTDIQRWQQR